MPGIKAALTGLISNPEELASEILSRSLSTPEEIHGLIAQYVNVDSGPLEELYTDAYAFGTEIAQELVSNVSKGDSALAELKAKAKAVWRGITQSVAKRTAKLLSQALPASAAELVQITQESSAEKAYAITQTEVTRSFTAAAYSVYQRANVATVSFITVADSRVCPVCDENENTGSILITESFPNGPPPCHPACRCHIVPDYIPGALDSATTYSDETITDEEDTGS